jgi:hypothetical protein
MDGVVSTDRDDSSTSDTLTLLLSTPGVIQAGFSGPFALSAVPGQFQIKDLTSFAACLWVLGMSFAEARSRRLLG